MFSKDLYCKHVKTRARFGKGITRRQILDSSKLKDFADDNFKYNENGRKLSRKLSKRVENTVEKGEIARYEQFLLFPQCFQKACFPGVSKGVIVWEWVKGYLRITPTMFDDILQRLAPRIQKRDTRFHNAIPSGLKLALTLRYMATGDCYASLAFDFRVGQQSVCNFVPEVCTALLD